MPDDFSPFVIDRNQTRVLADGHAFAEDFARCHAIVCPDVIDPDFLSTLQRITKRTTFMHDIVGGIGEREIEKPNRAGAALTLALGRQNFLRWIEQTTQCGPLESIGGGVAQMLPVNRHCLRWHNDLVEPGRRLAITINLSEDRYDGGLFELRSSITRKVMFQYQHVKAGTAVVFELAPNLEHRVLPLISGGPRRVYAGWFFTRAPA